MAKKREETKPSIKVYNTDIIIGNRYELFHKIDRDAPKPKNGDPTKKALSQRNGEKHSLAYDHDRKRWDTGLEVISPCNKGITGIEALVDSYQKLVQKPYEEYANVDTSATNNEFWDDYGYEIYPERVFDTNHAGDLFDLFHALKQGKICNSNEKDPILRQSAIYCVRDIQASVSAEDEKLLNYSEAVSTFVTMLNADDRKDESADLQTILEYIGFSSLREASKEDAKKQVLRAFADNKNGDLTVTRFLEAINKIKTQVGRKEIEIYAMLSQLRVANKLKFERQQFFLGSELLGNTLKAAAITLLNNPEKQEKVIKEWELIKK